MLDNVSPDRGLLRSIDDSSDAAGSNDDAVAVTFVPVHVGRASNLIVDQIRSLIRDGRLCLGDRLPSERELCEQFGVSRVTVREALRGLEANGLVSIRVGARGGAFVAAPTIQQVSEGIADLVAASVVRPDEVDEARRTLELGIVPLVCERADEQDIVDLLEISGRTRVLPESGDEHVVSMCSEFHIRMARATHNSAIEMMSRSLYEGSLTSSDRGSRGAAEFDRTADSEHREFALAVQQRNHKAARATMFNHLMSAQARAWPRDRPLLTH